MAKVDLDATDMRKLDLPPCGPMSTREEPDKQGCRNGISYTSHFPEDEHLIGRFPVDLEEVAIGMISGRTELFDIAHDTVLRYARKGVLIQARGKCPCSFRAAFRKLRATHPHAKWYYVGDEDVIINLAGLTKALSMYDPSEPTLVAANGCRVICDVCDTCPHMLMQNGALNVYGFHGGLGQILSAGLLKATEQGLEAACATKLRGGDLEDTCHLARAWRPSFRFAKLNVTRVDFATFADGPPDFVVAHHLCAEHVRRLAHVNRHLQAVNPELLAMPNSVNDGCEEEEAAAKEAW